MFLTEFCHAIRSGEHADVLARYQIESDLGDRSGTFRLLDRTVFRHLDIFDQPIFLCLIRQQDFEVPNRRAGQSSRANSVTVTSVIVMAPLGLVRDVRRVLLSKPSCEAHPDAAPPVTRTAASGAETGA